MVTQCHNITSRTILKVLSKGSCGSDLIHVDVASCSADQHDLHITEQASNRVIHPYLFDHSIPDKDAS
eukprot:1153094-Pelagomonas_calceolata.AAC.3